MKKSFACLLCGLFVFNSYTGNVFAGRHHFAHKSLKSFRIILSNTESCRCVFKINSKGCIDYRHYDLYKISGEDVVFVGENAPLILPDEIQNAANTEYRIPEPANINQYLEEQPGNLGDLFKSLNKSLGITESFGLKDIPDFIEK